MQDGQLLRQSASAGFYRALLLIIGLLSFGFLFHVAAYLANSPPAEKRRLKLMFPFCLSAAMPQAVGHFSWFRRVGYPRCAY